MPNLEVQRFSRGSTARLYLDIVVAGVGQTNEAPTVSIERLSDNTWFDGTAFVPTIVENAVTESDPANLPGVYFFDFNHVLDLTVSSEFLVRFKNAVPNAVLEHSHLIFGRLTDTVDAELCSVTGTIFTANGKRAQNVLVRATVIPVKTDNLGRGYQNVEVIQAYTDQLGQFEMPLVRLLNVRFEIPDIGLDKKVWIPDLPSVLFTAL